MPETLEFEEPIADPAQGDRGAQHAAADRRPRRRDRRPAPPHRSDPRRDLQAPDAVAARPGGAPSRAALPPRLRRAAVHRVRRAPRRSALRRRRRHRLRLRPLPRRAGAGLRPPEGPRHEAEGAAQLRLRPAGGLPQGAARDADGRQVRPADHRLRRHAGGLSRRRVRGARHRRGHRPEPARDGDPRACRSSSSSPAKAAAAARSASPSATAC